jgi:phosphoribosylamine---glycine ligase
MSNLETVAIIGAGGREGALADKYASSPNVGGILGIPGNDLMQLNTHGKPVETFQQIKLTAVKEIVDLCREKHVALVDVAQDNAVESGLVDALRKAGIRALGPTRDAGQLEWDKGYARDFMHRHAIPHPAYKIFHSPQDGIDYLESQPDQPWVVKASGLAEGKGVSVTSSSSDAVKKIMELPRFKGAGSTYLIEQCLMGEEFSTYALSTGEDYVLMGSAQDHKRVGENDTGENTGGMGCSTPPLVLTAHVMKQVREIFDKTFSGMKAEGRPYTGISYLGGMVDANQQVSVIEYNARWGDPEAQVIAPGLMGNFYESMQAAVDGNVKGISLRPDDKARVVITGASRGYPGDYSAVTGKEIFGIEEVSKMENVLLYGAGVKKEGNRYYAKGGRLVYVVGVGNNVILGRQRGYGAMSRLSVDGGNFVFRPDIGSRDVARLRKPA